MLKSSRVPINVFDDHLTWAAELPISEMKAVVPVFLKKISCYRSRFVCFVGIGIWTLLRKVLVANAATFQFYYLRITRSEK
ncbi:hypothetical protein EDD17DRAFT_1660535 [Pisolithus thermaeus]|nr:hypothetical protein EV401DRAFT_2032034 [Pisolithus croceorrhizus]KAI6143175.1 hypothetical protein EDD17DRAFT_1660535 [Pisolithus thermaeus]